MLDLIYFTWYNYMQYSECRTMFSLSLRKAVRCALCGAAQKHSRSYSITTFCSYPTGFREKCNPPGRASVLAVCMPVPGILMISCGKSSGVLAKGKGFALHSTADLFPLRGSNCLRTPSFGSILRHRRLSLCPSIMRKPDSQQFRCMHSGAASAQGRYNYASPSGHTEPVSAPQTGYIRLCRMRRYETPEMPHYHRACLFPGKSQSVWERHRIYSRDRKGELI